MKKNIVYAVIATLMVGLLLSFNSINTTNKTAKLNSCGASTTNLHVVSDNGTYITFGWDGVNSPDHYNYGGYYQTGGNFSGNTYSNTVTISKGGGGRFGITAYCSDGTNSGTGVNQTILF